MANQRFRIRAAILLIFLLVMGRFPLTAGAGPLTQAIPASYKQVAENAAFRLYVDSTNLAFKLLDKRNNYLWHSGLDEVADGDRLNKSWAAFALSGISMDYLDEKAISKRVSITNAAHTLDVTPVDQGVSGVATFRITASLSASFCNSKRMACASKFRRSPFVKAIPNSGLGRCMSTRFLARCVAAQSPATWYYRMARAA